MDTGLRRLRRRTQGIIAEVARLTRLVRVALIRVILI